MPGISLQPDPFAPEPAEARAQLDRLLASPHFCNSKRCQSLLRYVVEAYLEGALDRVRERAIGSAVFHREAGYDTNQDSVVRTTAAEVRKRLAQYYLGPEHQEELRLSLPPGSYVPEFRLPVAGTALAPVADELAPTRPARGLRLAGMILAVAVAVALGVYGWQSRIPAIDRFWAPIVGDRADAIICIEQPLKIYRIEGPRFDELNDKMVGTASTPPAGKDVLDATSLKLSDLTPAGSQYFTSGDLMVAVRLGELLARRKKTFQVLGDRAAAYHDLRGKPAILMGQFNNRWTLDFTGGLRYYLERDTTQHLYEVRDRNNQGKVIATAPQSADRPEEYAIVSRVFNPSTEKTVVTIMGMTQKGTVAGGDFLTNAAYMNDAFEKAPAAWYRKNIQVVLRTAMVGGAAGPPRPIATWFW